MTLILKLDLDIVKVSHRSKNEVSMSSFESHNPHRHTRTDRHAQTDTHTHRQYENITFPHTRAVKMKFQYKPIAHFVLMVDTMVMMGRASCKWHLVPRVLHTGF